MLEKEVQAEAKKHPAMKIEDVYELVMKRHNPKLIGFFRCKEAFAQEVASRQKINPIFFRGVNWSAFADELLATGYERKGNAYYGR